MEAMKASTILSPSLKFYSYLDSVIQPHYNYLLAIFAFFGGVIYYNVARNDDPRNFLVNLNGLILHNF